MAEKIAGLLLEPTFFFGSNFSIIASHKPQGNPYGKTVFSIETIATLSRLKVIASMSLTP